MIGCPASKLCDPDPDPDPDALLGDGCFFRLFFCAVGDDALPLAGSSAARLFFVALGTLGASSTVAVGKLQSLFRRCEGESTREPELRAATPRRTHHTLSTRLVPVVYDTAQLALSAELASQVARLPGSIAVLQSRRIG